jgi:hypothetical protein
MHQIRFKRGATVMLGCKAIDRTTGQGADLSQVTVESEVWPEKEGQAKVADLDVVWVNRAQGEFELWAPTTGLAASWPTGNLRVDIVYSEVQGTRTIRRPTETFYIYIEREVTRP